MYVFRCVSRVLLLFLQDYVKLNGHDDAPGCSSDKGIWSRILIVRYAILMPILVLYLAVSYTQAFMRGFWFGQIWCVTAGYDVQQHRHCAGLTSSHHVLCRAGCTVHLCPLM